MFLKFWVYYIFVSFVHLWLTRRTKNSWIEEILQTLVKWMSSMWTYAKVIHLTTMWFHCTCWSTLLFRRFIFIFMELVKTKEQSSNFNRSPLFYFGHVWAGNLFNWRHCLLVGNCLLEHPHDSFSHKLDIFGIHNMNCLTFHDTDLWMVGLLKRHVQIQFFLIDVILLIIFFLISIFNLFCTGHTFFRIGVLRIFMYSMIYLFFFTTMNFSRWLSKLI